MQFRFTEETRGLKHELKNSDLQNVKNVALFGANRIFKGRESQCTAVIGQAFERRLKITRLSSSPLGFPFRACYEHTILAMLFLPHYDPSEKSRPLLLALFKKSCYHHAQYLANETIKPEAQAQAKSRTIRSYTAFRQKPTREGSTLRTSGVNPGRADTDPSKINRKRNAPARIDSSIRLVSCIQSLSWLLVIVRSF